MLNEENLLHEKHSGGLVGHSGQDKTYAQFSSFYYYLGMSADDKKFVERCIIC